MFGYTIVMVVVVGEVVKILVLCFEVAHYAQHMLVAQLLEKATGC